MINLLGQSVGKEGGADKPERWISIYSKKYRNKKGHMGGLMLLFFTQIYVKTITH